MADLLGDGGPFARWVAVPVEAVDSRVNFQLVNNTVLASLAILKANWDVNQKSHLDSFLPFFLDAVNDTEATALDAGYICTLVTEKFGIKIPEAVMVSLMRRAVSRGFGKRENGRFLPDAAKMEPIVQLTAQRAMILRKQSALALRLVGFSRDNHGLLLSKEDAENAILEHVEIHAVPLISSIVTGRKYDANHEDIESKDVRFVVNSFIVDIIAHDPESFEHLETVVKGSMLAATLYLPNASEIGRKFNKTTIFLDTPLILRTLGYEGHEAQRAALDILDLCKENNALLACFAHTTKEVRGVLLAAAENLVRPSRDTTRMRGVGTHFSRESITSSEVMIFADSIEDDLKDLKIEVIEKPRITPDLSVDEDALQERLENSIHYTRLNGMFHDLDSLTAIHRLRGGHYTDRLEDCRAILVTSNTRLVGVSRAFFVIGGDRNWAPAISEHDLATLLWIKMPLSAPDLPRNQIVADCYSALEPGEALWQKYAEGIDRLAKQGTATEKDLMVLKYSGEARFALMNRTMGNPSRLTLDTLSDVLVDLRADAAAPAEAARLQAESVAANVSRELDTSTARLADEQRLRVQAETLGIEASSRLQALEAVQRNQRDSIRRRARRRGRIGRNISYGLATLLAISGALFTVVPALSDLLPSHLQMVPGIFAGALVVASSIALLIGGSIRGMSNSFEHFLANWAEKRLLENSGLEPETGT